MEKIYNHTQVNYREYLKFYEFILNQKFNSKFFKFLIALIAAFSLVVAVFFIIRLTAEYNIKNSDDLRLTIMFVLTIFNLGIISLLFKFDVRRLIYFKVMLILVFSQIVLTFLPNYDLFSIICLVVFLFFILQIMFMPNKLAKKTIATKGVTKYDFNFSDEVCDFKVEYIDFVSDESGQLKQIVQVADNQFKYESLVAAYVSKNYTYIRLDDGKYIFVDNNGFSDFKSFVNLLESKNIKLIKYQKFNLTR